MSKITLTPEQQAVKDHVVSNNGITLVAATAGSGKSFMARQLVKILQPKKVLYTAFNKAIVVEASELFPSNVQCKTLHALAYRCVKEYLDLSKISELTYRDVEEDIGYSSKRELLDGMSRFFVSSSTDMSEYFEETFKGQDAHLAVLAEKYVNLMLSGEVPPSFGMILKYFHLLLYEAKNNEGSTQTIG